MKLFYATGTCSLAPHIVLNEARIEYQTEKVDIRAKQYSGGDYRQVNPKGSVPALLLDNGELLTENAVVLQYIADLKPESGLAPQPGTWERVRLNEALNFITTEIHKSYGVLFAADRLVKNPDGNRELKAAQREAIQGKYELVTRFMGGNDYFMGAKFSLPDAYLYAVTRWAPFLEVDLSRFPSVTAFMKRMSERPAVRKAVEDEGMKL
jgi:glutathione S-transferase